MKAKHFMPFSNKDKTDNQRHFSFWNADYPLTSRRISIILGKPEEAAKLVKAVRKQRESRGQRKENLESVDG